MPDVTVTEREAIESELAIVKEELSALVKQNYDAGELMKQLNPETDDQPDSHINSDSWYDAYSQRDAYTTVKHQFYSSLIEYSKKLRQVDSLCERIKELDSNINDMA